MQAISALRSVRLRRGGPVGGAGRAVEAEALRPRSAELARIGLETDWEAVAVGVGVEGDDDGAGAGAGCCCSELAFLGLIDATGSATIAACEVTALRSVPSRWASQGVLYTAASQPQVG